MGWQVTVAKATLRESELTAGQQEALFTFANGGLPHTVADVHPAHCPVCRNATLVVALMSGGIDQDTAALFVFAMSIADADAAIGDENAPPVTAAPDPEPVAPATPAAAPIRTSAGTDPSGKRVVTFSSP